MRIHLVKPPEHYRQLLGENPVYGMGGPGGVEVDVRSAAPARVSVSGSGDEMTIVVDGTVARLRVRN